MVERGVPTFEKQLRRQEERTVDIERRLRELRSIPPGEDVGRGNEYATVVIAAANSSAAQRRAADIICTGQNDYLAVLAAVSRFPQNIARPIFFPNRPVGRIELLEGNYDFTGGGVDLTGLRLGAITIEGQGEGTIIELGASLAPAFTFGDQYGVRLRHMTIEGVRTVLVPDGLSNGYLIHLEDLFMYVTEDGDYPAIEIGSDASSVIRGCTLDGWYESTYVNDGIKIGTNSYGGHLIEGNVIVGTMQGVRTRSDYTRIANNLFRGIGDNGLAVHLGSGGLVNQCVVVGNVILDGGAIAIEVEGDQCSIVGNTNKNGAFGGMGQIHVNGGTECEVVANHADSIFFDGCSENTCVGNVVKPAGADGIIIENSSEITVSANHTFGGNFRIEDSSELALTGNMPEGKLSFDSCSNSTVVGNKIEADTGISVEMDNCAEMVVSDNQTEGKIALVSTFRSVIGGNVLDYVGFGIAGLDGISLSGSSDNLITGNYIEDFADWGIFLTSNCDDNNIQHNTIRQTNAMKIDTSDCNANLVTNNDHKGGTFTDNGTATVTAAGNRA